MTNASSSPIKIYTDGACSGNPGPGGWGAVIYMPTGIQELSGGAIQTTNNRMELTAAIEAIKVMQAQDILEIYTDSLYLRDGINAWLVKWKNNGWLTAQKKAVKNVDLWVELDCLVQRRIITWHWVRGHSGHPDNERADLLARNAIVQQIMQIEMAS